MGSHLRNASIVLLALGLGLGCWPHAAHAGWASEEVRAGSSNLLSYTWIAAGAGKIHVGFEQDGDAVLATHDSGRWSTATLEPFEPDGSNAPHFAMDGKGNLHRVSLQAQTYELRYGTNAGGTWAFSTIPTNPANTSDLAIAVESSGQPHVVYVARPDPSSKLLELRHATLVAGSWSTETIAQGADVLRMPWIAVDVAGAVHLTWYRGNVGPAKAMYATSRSGSWSTVEIDDSLSAIAIATDAGGNAHACYGEPGGAIRYATNASGAWTHADVDPGGGYWCSIAVGARGDAHVAYIGPAYTLRYATNSSGAWRTSNADVSPLHGMYYSSIALDPGGTIHVVYSDWDWGAGSDSVRHAVARTRFEERDSVIRYAGDWRAVSCSPCSGKGAMVHGGLLQLSGALARPSSSATFTFMGTDVTWISGRSNASGKAKVFVDGALVSTVDLYGATSSANEVVFHQRKLSNQRHTLRIETLPLRSRNPASRGDAVAVDAFQVR